MKFYDFRGTLVQNKGYSSSVRNAETKDTDTLEKLSEQLTKALARIAELEKRTPPESSEFEFKLTLTSGSTSVSFAHNYGTAVRWWITNSQIDSASGTIMPSFSVNHSLSTENVLVLNVYLPDALQDIRGIFAIRIEPSQFPTNRLD